MPYFQLIVLGFNDMSTLVGHFVSSPTEREKRDSRGDERKGQGRKRNRNESEETVEIKTFPFYPYLLQGEQDMPNWKPISVGHPGDLRYPTPLHLTFKLVCSRVVGLMVLSTIGISVQSSHLPKRGGENLKRTNNGRANPLKGSAEGH